MIGAKVGLLPLYLKLYDDALPGVRRECEAFHQAVVTDLQKEGVSVYTSDFCRVHSEIQSALNQFRDIGIDLLITLHVAYSPSLEAATSLIEWNGPILILDTTPDFTFSQDVSAERIMFNHGIHGVQDLASVLRQHGRPYDIVAGHYAQSPVLSRAAGRARAAVAAQEFRNARVLRVGTLFKGMGDFLVDENLLKSRFGIQVDTISVSDLVEEVISITEEEVDAENREDGAAYLCHANLKALSYSNRVGLGLRKRLTQDKYSAFTMNFMSFDGTPPIPTVPFLEASKAMARGLGYAGESDALTAAFVGSLNAGFGNTTFTEVFCPDWENNTLFLSHMGEYNPVVAAEKPILIEKSFPWTNAQDPVTIACAPASGPAILANLSPGPEGSFRLIITPVQIIQDQVKGEMAKTIRAWIRPVLPLPEFLERYSIAGGTHHSALILGRDSEEIAAYGRYLKIETILLE